MAAFAGAIEMGAEMIETDVRRTRAGRIVLAHDPLRGDAAIPPWPRRGPPHMELVIRKYFWAVHLCFVALVALLAAKTVNLFFEAAIAPAPSAPTGRGASRVAQAEAPAALDLPKLAQLTNLPLPVAETEVEAQKPDMSAEPVRTSLRLKLLGTLVSTLPNWSIGSILDLNNQKSSTLMVGDRVQNAEVLSVERDRVIIANNGRREYIGAEGRRRRTAAAAHRHHRPVSEPGGNAVRSRDQGARREQLRGPPHTRWTRRWRT